jgi:hypothetical protein
MARRNSILVSKTLYQIGVLTLITSILWTAITVMQAISQAPNKVEVGSKILEPINVSMDKEIIEMLSNRKKVDVGNIPQPTTEPVIASGSANATSSATIKVSGE